VTGRNNSGVDKILKFEFKNFTTKIKTLKILNKKYKFTELKIALFNFSRLCIKYNVLSWLIRYHNSPKV
jgi:hypothetical protein